MTQSGSTAIYKAGSEFFRQGDGAADAYLILRGMVEISTNQMGKKLVFANLGPQEVFGELALISQQPRTATALAVEETEVLVITRKHLQELIDSADPLLTNLMQGYLGRFMWTQRFMLHNSSGHLHAGGDSLQKQADQELALEKEIDQAIQNHDFELFYQPVVKLRSGRIAGFEALMRWRHPSRGLVSPVEFIGLAEKTGQIVDMGYWALEQALADLLKLQDASDKALIEDDSGDESEGELFMSVNVSGRQLLELEEIERLGALLARSGVAPERIKLEITESLLVNDPAHAAVALGKLREKGVRLAIDDFGTGYSSLSYLHLFPLDTLKIDHSFVSNMLKDERRFRIVRAISRLARDLDLDVIAEGIETPQELEKLRKLECDYIQGFLFARPAPFEKVETLLASHPFYS